MDVLLNCLWERLACGRCPTNVISFLIQTYLPHCFIQICLFTYVSTLPQCARAQSRPVPPQLCFLTLSLLLDTECKCVHSECKSSRAGKMGKQKGKQMGGKEGTESQASLHTQHEVPTVYKSLCFSYVCLRYILIVLRNYRIIQIDLILQSPVKKT